MQDDSLLNQKRLASSADPGSGAEPPQDDEAVWTYRGYKMRPAEFNTAWVHYYRAEIQRSNTWRTRLDATTNWAVVTVAAAISFALSSPTNHYGVIILDLMLLNLFLWIEARRYRYYELWSYRARLLETNFFAAMLVPPFRPDPGWAEALAGSLRAPKFTVGIWEAVGRRLRRNYLWMYLILDSAWALKSFVHPTPAASWSEFVDRSSLGGIPGLLIIGIGIIFNLGLVFIALFSLKLKNSSGEVGLLDSSFTAPDNFSD